MRKGFTDQMIQLARKDPDFIFLTGDLGFNAFEQLREEMGNRFINAGVAEQNMIGVAAGLALQGHSVAVYSIAPFVTLRCLEQIRNDVCFHKLPVMIVGNGGGYGYGIMGSSHHALEDIAVTASLPNMTCYLPAFGDEVAPLLEKAYQSKSPAYIRLGLAAKSPSPAKMHGNFRVIQQVIEPIATIIAAGPVAASVIGIRDDVDIFTLQSLPVGEIPEIAMYSMLNSRNLMVVEEHVKHGGIGESLIAAIVPDVGTSFFIHHAHAAGYPDNLYGSRDYHLKQSGLDRESLAEALTNLTMDW
ncbi:MAG: transketolase [Bacteroidetes bacterium]|nr:transketolase [Bacteroidota bacterium]MBU1719677.1 transketolase [Bacteroidota bacterium]